MSEVLLGIALRGVPRDSYILCTKLGRYDLAHFDFESVGVFDGLLHLVEFCLHFAVALRQFSHGRHPSEVTPR